jgi:hypothetical protein
MSGIYLSYRRIESAAYAGRLFDHLSRHFGPGSVFMDIQGGITSGQDFALAIESALNVCDVALVVIGNTWAICTRQDGQRRLDDPNDWVRIETAAALRRNVLVVPVLVDGARLPDPASLPEELRPLCRRHACELTDLRWSYDVGELVKVLDKVVRPTNRLKFPRLKDKRLRWLGGSAIVLAFLMALFGPSVVRLKSPLPASPTPSPTTAVIPSPAASQSEQPTLKSASSRRQETSVAGLVAELARFVYTENFITAEVTFRNVGSESVKFCFWFWTLIDEQTADKSDPDSVGGSINCYQKETLAPGATHVAWAKFKSNHFSAHKYSLDIGGILNRPFEGITLKSEQ